MTLMFLVPGSLLPLILGLVMRRPELRLFEPRENVLESSLSSVLQLLALSL